MYATVQIQYENDILMEDSFTLQYKALYDLIFFIISFIQNSYK